MRLLMTGHSPTNSIVNDLMRLGMAGLLHGFRILKFAVILLLICQCLSYCLVTNQVRDVCMSFISLYIPKSITNLDV